MATDRKQQQTLYPRQLLASQDLCPPTWAVEVAVLSMIKPLTRAIQSPIRMPNV